MRVNARDTVSPVHLKDAQGARAHNPGRGAGAALYVMLHCLLESVSVRRIFHGAAADGASVRHFSLTQGNRHKKEMHITPLPHRNTGSFTGADGTKSPVGVKRFF